MAWRIGGGYLFDLAPNFSVGPELSYGTAPYNTLTYTHSDGTIDSKITASSIDLVANAIYQFNDQWFAKGKLGLASVSQKIKTTGAVDPVPDTNKSSALPIVSLGGGFSINKHMSIDISYNQVFGADKPQSKGEDKVASIETYMLGFNYAF